MRRLAARLFAAALLLAPLAARADIIIASGNNPQPDENVLLNNGGLGTTIFGTTNQTGFQVGFRSLNGSTLLAPSSGQARVEGMGAGGFTIFLPGATATSVIFNLDAAVNGSTTFSVLEPNGQTTQGTFALGGSGQNFFTITAINGQSISSVTIGGGTNLTDVSQVRIGGAIAVIPEPGTVVLLATGLLAVAGVARRRRTAA